MAGRLATGISLRVWKLGAGVSVNVILLQSVIKRVLDKYESLSMSRNRKTHVISAFVYYARKSCALNLFLAAL
ncbi:hypothetical protein J6590_095248 [Homalodisca vitripennis]|nr:hypothetical protein J6590_095248 [Homalodisca vitripennis]